MTFRFENLKVWQEARVFAVKIYKITSNFPRDEKFALVDQFGPIYQEANTLSSKINALINSIKKQ